MISFLFPFLNFIWLDIYKISTFDLVFFIENLYVVTFIHNIDCCSPFSKETLLNCYNFYSLAVLFFIFNLNLIGYLLHKISTFDIFYRKSLWLRLSLTILLFVVDFQRKLYWFKIVDLISFSLLYQYHFKALERSFYN